MKRQILLLAIFAFLFTACTEPITREVPTKQNQIVSLGFYPLSDITREFTPYFNVTTMIFVDAEGTEYEWRMQQPNITNSFSFTRTFPHPFQSGFVDYKYAGERVIFEFLCSELGAKLLVQLEPDFCWDPMLDDDIVPTNYVNIRGRGFNANDVTLPNPVLSIATSENQACRGARNLGTVTLIDRSFDRVTTNRQELDDERFLEVYFTPNEGLVGIRTGYMFLELKEAF
ncbi:MAG: hypothetical protein AAFZ63_11840 [Bacteroidota bacterium]